MEGKRNGCRKVGRKEGRRREGGRKEGKESREGR
jgi:hypothetical protein